MRSLSLGTGPDSAWFNGTIWLCDEHATIKDHLTPFLRLVGVLYAERENLVIVRGDDSV